MNAGPVSPWVLVRELGLDYAGYSGPRGSVDLACPVAVEHLSGGGILIVDDTAADGMPLRMQCRTLLLSPERRVVYDSLAQGIGEGYGCAISGERIALLQCPGPELLVLSQTGVVLQRIDLSGISRNHPRLLSWTHRGTFLIVFFEYIQELEFAEVDCHGRVLWFISLTQPTVGMPGSMQLLQNDSVLIADEFHNVVWEMERSGRASIRWGKFHESSAADGYLHRPRWARLLEDETLLIADTHNHRVLSIDPDGRSTRIQPVDTELFAPSFVARRPNGNHLICDAGNRCIYELDSARRIVWTEGTPVAKSRLFSFPRSVQYLGNARYLVADTAHDRVVEIDAQSLHGRTVREAQTLFWPRAARMTVNGSMLIADGRNGRILEVAPEGHLLRQLDRIRYEGRNIEFSDPHDVRELSNGNVLIVDSALNLVCETDWNGLAVWLLDPGCSVTVRDPHSAQQLPDGRFMISDRGNHRVLFIDPLTGDNQALGEIRFGGRTLRLDSPRCADLATDGSLAIVDSGNNRVLITNLRQEFLWELSDIPQSPRPYLRYPRWAHLVSRDEIVISDHFNHRIVHLRRRADSVSLKSAHGKNTENPRTEGRIPDAGQAKIC